MKKWVHLLICAIALLVITGCGKENKTEKSTETAYEIETYASSEEDLRPFKVQRLDEQTLLIYGSNDTYEEALFKVDLKNKKTTLVMELKDNQEIYFTEKGCLWIEAKGLWEVRDKFFAQTEENEEQFDALQEAYYQEREALDRQLMYLDYGQTKPEQLIASTENIKIQNFTIISSDELQIDFQDKKENNYFKMSFDIETKKSTEIKEKDVFSLVKLAHSDDFLTVNYETETLMIKAAKDHQQKKLKMPYPKESYYDYVSYLDNDLLFLELSFSDKDDAVKRTLQRYDVKKKKAENIEFENVDLQKVIKMDALENYVIVSYESEDEEAKSSLQVFENDEFKQVQVDELEKGKYQFVSNDNGDEWILYDHENLDKQWMMINVKGAKE
ncbi:hypothetical protein [Isobaculum melis]|uniref:Lipoprotein n=1 Tax=Isobaculum melis TaxID=142588 RepID=A0A1H9RSQ8_9LACT|nr:hypothetical protein [Isobaculum melis]SER75485.1 hypothetical protein SAMN04488559_10532 [Isobaculum melis]